MKKVLPFIICLFSIAIEAQTVSTVTPEINGSGGLCMDSEGNVYIADFGDMLGGPDADGQPNDILVLDTDNNLSVYATGFIGASGNNFDNNGVLHQSDIRANGIYKIENGNRILVSNSGIIAPVGVVFDSNDNFYVCNCGTNTIQKVTPSGTSTVFSSGSEFSCPNGMTIDEDDNLYVVNFSNTNVVRIDQSGSPTVIANTLAGNGHIDYDPNTENLYIASFAGQQIYYLNKNDLVLTVLAGEAGVRGNDDGDIDDATFSNPNGIVVSTDGNEIYINSAAQVTGTALNPQIVRKITDVLNLFSVQDQINAASNVLAYPNPAKHELTIETLQQISAPSIDLKMFDISGKLLLEESVQTGSLQQGFRHTINISNLSNGNYFYTLGNEGKVAFSGRFTKN